MATPPAPDDAPREETLREAADRLRAARRARAGIDRAATFAAWSGGSLAVFAAITLLASLAGGVDAAGLLLGVALAAAATLEFRGRSRLQRLEPAGPRLLANNQLFIGGIVAAWCVYRVAAGGAGGAGTGIDAELLAANPELGPMLGDVQGLLGEVVTLAYAVVGFVAVAVQLLAWRFHRRRIAMLDAFLRDVPAWARET